MHLLKHHSNLIHQVTALMYACDEEYENFTFEQALPRITPIIITMTMREMLEYISKETPLHDTKRLIKNNHFAGPLYFGRLRPEHPTPLNGAYQ